MVWVYNHYLYYYSPSDVLRRQIMTTKVDPCAVRVKPSPAKLSILNVYPLEVVSRYRDPQLQVGKNYSSDKTNDIDIVFIPPHSRILPHPEM